MPADPRPIDRAPGPLGRVPRSGPVSRAASRLGGHRPQLQASFWFTVAVAITAVGGFLFWLVAARHYPEAAVGRAASAFTAVQFLIYGAGLGLPVGIARYAPDASPRSDRIFAWAVVTTTVAGVVSALLLYIILPTEVVNPSDGSGASPGVLLFAFTATGVTLGVLVEIRLLTLRRWGPVVARAVVVAVGRLPLLAWQPFGEERSGLWLFVLVAVVPALSGYLLLTLEIVARGRPVLRPAPGTLDPFLRFSLVNYVGILALLAPQFVLPLILSVHVAPEVMAAFYVAFSVTAVVFLIPQTLAQVLLAEGGKDHRQPRSQLKLGLLLGITAAVAATVVVVIGASAVTAVYGAAYRVAADVLPWLAAPAIPWAVTSMLLASARLVEDRVAILSITITAPLAILVPAFVLIPDHGVGGATVAWVVGNVVTALVAIATSWRVVPELERLSV